jgi:hypothetical protein
VDAPSGLAEQDGGLAHVIQSADALLALDGYPGRIDLPLQGGGTLEHEEGRTLDFHLSPTRSAKAAKRFLGKAIRQCKAWETPLTLTTDKAPTYPLAIAELKREGRCPPEVVHRRAKYLNNVIEADHGQLKRLIRPTLSFESMRTAYATIKGFEVMRALKKGQDGPHQVQDGIRGEVRSVERAFGIGPDALSEMFDRLQALDLAA